ncbi:hypothetical protein [Pandoraea communis]|uniref:hypothetical protein n=1 Tax=Pandoraea communis TaxID=2508297 RepID=UPI0025A4DCC9|nr:hypothetical protein [Pandoraea communis]MDM8355706.1 hypothetical protein [Pandoraea communis]
MIVNPNLRILSVNDGFVAYLVGVGKEFLFSKNLVSLILRLKDSQGDGRRVGDIWSEVDSDIAKMLIESGVVIVNSNQWENSTESADGMWCLNWSVSADYLRQTFDYPFFDYGDDGWVRDAEMMEMYREKSEEIPRSKSSLRKANAGDYSGYKRSIQRIRRGNFGHAHADITDAVTASVGVKGVKPISWGDPLLRKNVPSGGGRHPTEVYLLDFANGTGFHFDSLASDFECIGKFNPRKFYKSAFFEPNSYVKFDVNMALVFTSIWERNMYRYREPRTFRSVHLDVGHVSCSVELILRYMKYKFHVQYSTNCEVIEELIGVDPLSEGVMSSIMIGGRE